MRIRPEVWRVDEAPSELRGIEFDLTRSIWTSLGYDGSAARRSAERWATWASTAPTATR
jgi:hypothetical protein